MSGLYERELDFHEEYNFNEKLTPLSYNEEAGFFYLYPGKKKSNSDSVTASIGWGFISHPMTGSDESTTAKLNALLAMPFPKDSVVHCMLYASPDVAMHTAKMQDLREEGSYYPMLDAMIEEKVNFIQEHTKKRISKRIKPLVRDFILVFTAKIPITGMQPTQEELANLNDLRVSMHQVLETIGVAPTPLHPEHYLRFMGSLINWKEDASWRVSKDSLWDKERVLREQVKDADVRVEVRDSCLKIGPKFVRCLSPKRLPQFHSLWRMSNFIGDPLGSRGIPGNFAMSLIVRFLDDAVAKPALATKRNVVNYQAYGPLLKWVPALAAKKQSFDVLFQSLDKGDRAVQIYPAFITFNDTEEDSTAAVSNMMAYYRELGWVLQPDHFIQLATFLNHLPFNADLTAEKFLARYSTVASRHAAEFFPIIADWKGTGTPALTLFSRNNQPMAMDLYDSNSNFNCVISAASGSGKSFFMNELIISYLSMAGSQFWVIDVGYSYKNLCEEIGGTFIEFTEEAGIILNPFKLIENFEDDGEMLVGLLVSMAQENEKLSDVQLSTLRHVLHELWNEQGRESTIDMVAEVLKMSSDTRIADVGSRLFPFTTEGPYGKYFHGEPNVNFGGRFTVLELEQLKSRPALQRVVLLMLALQISRQMYLGGLDRRKFMVIDEAWELLAHPSVSAFIEGLYRKARKVRGSAIIITQAITDIYNSSTGEAIAANSAHKYLLAQTPETITRLQKEGKLALGEWGFEMLKSVHTVKGEYSEVLAYTNYGMGVGRLIVDRFGQLLYSTDPDDRRAIKRRTDKGMGTSEAIQDIIKLEKEYGKKHKEIEKT